MNFEPQNDLERLLVKAASDPAYRFQFYRELVQSNIFAVQHGQPAARPEGMGETNIPIQQIVYDGKLYIPIFSSLPRLLAILNSDTAYVEMNALALMKCTGETPIFLNPGSQYGKEFLTKEIAMLVDGSFWKQTQELRLEKATQVMVGPPKKPPGELVAALARYFQTKSQVQKAWFALYFNPSDGLPPHTLIVIEITGNVEEVMAEAAFIATSVEVPDRPIDFLPVTSGSGENNFVKSSQLFYPRSPGTQGEG